MITEKQLAHLVFKNKYLQSLSTNAGCYHCIKTFFSKDVKQFTDEGQTAICPYCFTDTVVFDNCGFELTLDNLQKANKYWFSI